MQMKIPRRTNQQRSDATRAALLDAARALFVDKGYAETGTPEIVRAASVTRGALYHHFADKADLLRGVIVRELERVASEIDQAAADAPSTMDALTQGAVAWFNAMSDPGSTRLLLLDGPVSGLRFRCCWFAVFNNFVAAASHSCLKFCHRRCSGHICQLLVSRRLCVL